MGRPGHWEDGAPFQVVSVPGTVRKRVWSHNAGAYRPRVLRFDNPGSMPIAVFVECADDRTTRTTELRLPPGGGDELRVRGAVFVDANQLDAAGVATELRIACVDADTQGGDPNTDVRVTLLAGVLGAPGVWVDIGWLPPGRRWVSALPFKALTVTDFQFLDALNVVRGGFQIQSGGAPVTVIHPPSCKLQARTTDDVNIPLLVAYATR